MHILDMGVMEYRAAWRAQEKAHEDVVNGAEEQLLLVEHPPVITFGRRLEANRNVIASAEQLERLGVDVVQSDRGGDVTFHGPGQIVAYPIVRLNDHALSVGGYVRRLEEIVIATLATFGVAAQKDACAIGVWARDPTQGDQLAKICALGVRIRRGVSLHGIALNVETDLSYFNLIVPCGLVGRPVTSLRKLLGDVAPSIESVKRELALQMMAAFTRATSAPRV
jgi:lipoate-protein ligase B